MCHLNRTERDREGGEGGVPANKVCTHRNVSSRGLRQTLASFGFVQWLNEGVETGSVAAADSRVPKVLFKCLTTEKQRACRPRPPLPTVSSLNRQKQAGLYWNPLGHAPFSYSQYARFPGLVSLVKQPVDKQTGVFRPPPQAPPLPPCAPITWSDRKK